MGMVIHDDYWAAVQALPRSQRQACLYALAEYGMEGREPAGSPPWLPLFIALRGRVALGAKRSRAGGSGGRATRRGREAPPGGGEADGAVAREAMDRFASQAKPEFACEAKAEVACDDSEQQSQKLPTRVEDEVEGEVEGEVERTPSPPYGEIVERLNRAAGTAYRPTSRRTRSLIRARWSEGYRLEDFGRVIDRMSAEWRGDPKMAPYLRPETLFGVKFESYLNRPAPGAPRREEDGYAVYD